MTVTPAEGHPPRSFAGAGRENGRTLELHAVRAGYSDREVLHGVDLHLEAGAVHGLVGLNGAGKTTLLETIAGLLPLAGGSMRLSGAALTRSHVSYLPAEMYFYPSLTGREYLRVFEEAGHVRHAPVDVDAWSAVFDVPLDGVIDEYSAGMRRKLGLIAAVTLHRPVLLLDEPANALDLESNALLGDLLRAMADGGCVVVVTSHILAALSSCDRVHRLAAGRITGSYLPAEFPTLVEHLMTNDLGARRDALVALARTVGGADDGRP